MASADGLYLAFLCLDRREDSIFKVVNPVCDSHRGFPVWDKDDADFLLLLCQRSQNDSFIDGIDVAGRLVKEDQLASLEEGT